MADSIHQFEADLCEALEIRRLNAPGWWIAMPDGNDLMARTETLRGELLANGGTPMEPYENPAEYPAVASEAFGLVVKALGKRALGFDLEPVLMLDRHPAEVHSAARIFRMHKTSEGTLRDPHYLREPAEAFPDWREAVCRAALAYLKAEVWEEVDAEYEDCNACERCHGCLAACGCSPEIDACPNCGHQRITKPEVIGVDQAEPGGDRAVTRTLYPCEVRPAGCRPEPGNRWKHRRFSVGIGPGPKASRWNPALYRVSGLSADEAQVDALAARLVAWLNNPLRADNCPQEIPYSNDKSARIKLTAAGKRAGFLPPGI